MVRASNVVPSGTTVGGGPLAVEPPEVAVELVPRQRRDFRGNCGRAEQQSETDYENSRVVFGYRKRSKPTCFTALGNYRSRNSHTDSGQEVYGYDLRAPTRKDSVSGFPS